MTPVRCERCCAQLFLRAAQEVLAQVLDEAVAACEIVRMAQPISLQDMVVVLGLTGDQEGRVLFEFAGDTALRVAGVMNFGENFEEFNGMAGATLSELGNLIAGRAATLFNDSGGKLDISPPFVMRGVGMRSSDPMQRMSLVTSCGPVIVNFSTKRTKSAVTRIGERRP